MRPSDFDIIAGCKKRDPKAVEWLYKTHSPWMLGICMRYFSDRMEAEDIVHESFIAICDKIGSLKDEKALEAWMKRIVINNCLMGIRKKVSTVAIEEFFDADLTDSEIDASETLKDKLLEAEFSTDVVLAIVQELPVGFRTVFNLYVFEGYNHQQIGAELGISEGTSKSQLMRARKAIQQRLAEWLIDEEKKKKKRNVLAYSMLFIMNNDLEYIDKLVFEKLHDFQLHLISPPPVLDGPGIELQGATTSGKTFLATVAGKVAFSLMIIGTIWISYRFFRNGNEKSMLPNQTGNGQVVLSQDTVLTDSAINEKPIVNQADSTVSKPVIPKKSISKPIKIEEKKTVYDTVQVKKVIKVKKKRVVTRSIKKTDTLPH